MNLDQICSKFMIYLWKHVIIYFSRMASCGWMNGKCVRIVWGCKNTLTVFIVGPSHMNSALTEPTLHIVPVPQPTSTEFKNSFFLINSLFWLHNLLICFFQTFINSHLIYLFLHQKKYKVHLSSQMAISRFQNHIFRFSKRNISMTPILNSPQVH